MDRLALAVATSLVVGMVALFCVRAQWIQRKTETVRNPPAITSDTWPRCSAVTNSVVLIGDSRISRWPRELMSGPRIINRGHAGETALAMAGRFGPDALAGCPGTVLIASGINDLVAASLMTEDAARATVDRVVATLIQLAERSGQIGIQVYLATIVPPGAPDLLRRFVWSWSLVGYVSQVNEALRAHSWPAGVTLVDFAAQLDPDAVGLLGVGYRHDTLHLTYSAYLQLTKLLPFGNTH